MKRALVVVPVVVVAVIAVAGFLWLRGGDEPAPLDVDDAASQPTAEPADSIAGTWTVEQGEDTVAGLRIDEERAAGLGDHTAVGRTGAVSGELTVEGETLTGGEFTVDLRSIEFTDDPGLPVANRSEYLRTSALETDTFPTATFTVGEPVALPELGAATVVEVPGTFELRGVSRPMTIPVEVRAGSDQVVIGTETPVTVRLSDHEITPPEIPGVAKVVDEGQFEFVVVLRRD